MNGVYLGDFATGFSFTEQITEIESGNILFASFSAPSGVHEFASDGTFIGYYDIVGSLRGVYELPNGNILVTNSDGVYEIDRNNTIVSTKISGVNARSINFVEPVSPFPPPTNVAVDEELGTVTWDPPVTNMTRDLTGYNVYLDDMVTPIITVGFDVFEYQYTGLIPDQTYIAGVSAVYDDPGESEIVEVEFTYSPIILNPPQNLNVEIIENYALLTWDPPEMLSGEASRDLLGYNVYLDDVFVAFTTFLEWFFFGLTYCDYYTVGVSAVYDEGESEIIEITFHYTGLYAGNDVQFVNELSGNFPNPFNPTTTILFSVTQTSSFVTLEIYNIKGQKIKTLVNKLIPAGEHSAFWNGRDSNDKQVGSGIYFYKLKAGEFQKVKKMVLIK